MSVCTFGQAVERVKAATPGSPVAVFDVRVANKVNVVFANTVATQQRIRAGDVTLVGVFHNKMEDGAVKDKLRSACRETSVAAT